MSNKSIPYFIVNLWRLYDNMCFDSTKNIDSRKSLDQSSWILKIVTSIFWIPSFSFDSFAFVVHLDW